MVLYFKASTLESYTDISRSRLKLSSNTLLASILTKNLPSNLGEFSLVYLYIFTIVPSSILVGFEPSGLSDMKLISFPNFLSNLTLYSAVAKSLPPSPSI